MQHGGENRTLYRNCELTSPQQLAYELTASCLLPQPAKNQWPTDALARHALERPLPQSGDQHCSLAQTRSRTQQHIEFAAGLKFVHAAQRAQNTLLCFAAITRVLDDLQIPTLTGWFNAEEHGGAPWRDTAH